MSDNTIPKNVIQESLLNITLRQQHHDSTPTLWPHKTLTLMNLKPLINFRFGEENKIVQRTIVP